MAELDKERESRELADDRCKAKDIVIENQRRQLVYFEEL